MAGYCEKKDPLEFSTEIEKWDQETPADGKEMAKPIEKLYNNTEYNKKGVEDVKNPEFDASGNASGITNFQKLIDSITSKMSIFSFFANLKTGLKYVLDVGKIVNNGTTTEAGKFVLDAIQANPNIAGTLAKQIQENASAISSLNARNTVSFTYPAGISHQAGASFCRNNITYVNECINVTATVKKQGTIIDSIKIGGQSIDANYTYGILVKNEGKVATSCVLNSNGDLTGKIITEADLDTGFWTVYMAIVQK